MTKEDFIQYLEGIGFQEDMHYKLEGDSIIISAYSIYFEVKSLPDNVIFNNKGNISLHLLKELPPSTQFNNGDAIMLNSLTSIPDDFKFNNKGTIRVPNVKEYKYLGKAYKLETFGAFTFIINSEKPIRRGEYDITLYEGGTFRGGDNDNKLNYYYILEYLDDQVIKSAFDVTLEGAFRKLKWEVFRDFSVFDFIKFEDFKI